MKDHEYPKEIQDLDAEVKSRRLSGKPHKRLQRRLDKMQQLYWMVVLDNWIKKLGV